MAGKAPGQTWSAHVVRMNLERLREAPAQEAFNSLLHWSFSGIPVKVGGTELEGSLLKASIAEAVAASCGHKVLGNPRTA